MNNGTVFFVDCGEGPIGLTAEHNSHALREDLIAHPKLVCQLGDLEVDFLDRAISQDRELDICTFRIDPAELQKVGAKVHEPGDMSHRDDLADVGLIFGGYIRNEARDLGGSLGFDFQAAITIPSQVFPSYITIELDRDYVEDARGVKVLPEGAAWGGASGGPVFALTKQRDVMTWFAVGVLGEHHEEGEFFKAGLLNCVDPDGNIQRGVV